MRRQQAYWLVEDRGENQQENSVKEVDCCDGDVKCVGLLVHPWPENADANEKASLDDNQCNGLSDAAVLAKSDEQCFDQNITQTRHDEVVGGRTELDI